MNSEKRRLELYRDLTDYPPKRWRFNLPLRDYTLRREDIIPALSGAIGKIALVSGFVIAWAGALHIGDSPHVTEMVRLELFVASVLTLIFCAFLNPSAAPPGSLAPVIPLVAVFAAQGVHPMALGILIGVMGLAFSYFNVFSMIVSVTEPGIRGGIILLFSVMGISSALQNVNAWASGAGEPAMTALLIVPCAVLYAVISRLNLKWLAIPLCGGLALILAAAAGHYPILRTPVSLPVIHPIWWWTEFWGTGPAANLQSFLKAFPYALLVMVMWPIDALPVRGLQEQNYPREAAHAHFHMRDTFLVVSLRNLLGTLLGGAHIAGIWRSFMIPLATVKRPIAGSALLLGVTGLAFAIAGFPIDIAVFPPLLWIVLIFGVHVPLLETGLAMIKKKENALAASVCFILGIALSPIIGWSVSLLISDVSMENTGGKRRLRIRSTKTFLTGCAVTLLYALTVR